MIQRNKKKSLIEDKPTRYFSNKQEKTVAKDFNGKKQANSGATAFAKGDVIIDNFLLECKTKTASSDSISIKKSWIEKNRAEALFMGKPYSAICFNFGPDEENFYIIDRELMEILIEKVKEK